MRKNFVVRESDALYLVKEIERFVSVSDVYVTDWKPDKQFWEVSFKTSKRKFASIIENLSRSGKTCLVSKNKSVYCLYCRDEKEA